MLQQNIQIIFEDAHLLVINKPSGLIVNKSDTSVSNNLQTQLEDYLKLDASAAYNTEFYDRCGIVHRLDKDTSGVLLVAKDEETFIALQNQFKERAVKKTYMALVHGKAGSGNIIINAPINRDVQNRLKYAVSPQGKEAVTEARKVNEFSFDDEWVSLMKVHPLTGRTHQIRVHMCALGHPVVGDKTYTSLKRLRWAYEHNFTRMMLHACAVELTYKGELKVFEAPLPSDFA